MDQFDPKDKVVLRLYCDCCYSGQWIKRLEKGKIKSRGVTEINIYTACDDYELAEESYFSTLLKGQVPEIMGSEF